MVDVLFILFIIFLLAFLVQLYFFLVIFVPLSKFKEPKSNFSSGVSVVVCGYNEAKYWNQLVDQLLKQDYEQYEIVLVNDQSTDDTKYILKQWEGHPKIKIVNIAKDIKKGIGKKFALTLGIKAAKYEYLLLTDADCLPKNQYWIRSMSQHFSTKEIVLGYGGYYKQRGLLNQLIRFDTFLVALQYFSFALKGRAYMGVGRNLAYKKSVFFDNRGFASHLHIPSGDDDLFIKEVSNSTNTAISLDVNSHTLSEPKISYLAWIRQKTRHITTANHYKPYHQWLLAAWSTSQLLFWVLFIVMLSSDYFRLYGIALFFIRLVVQLIIVRPIMKKIYEEDLIFYYPFLEIILNVFYLIFMLNRLIFRKRFW